MRVETRAHARPKTKAVRRGRLAPGFSVCFFLALSCLLTTPHTRAAQRELTPLQQEIKVLTTRLSSSDVEERREAVMRLGALGRPEGSRAAAAALGDAAAIVRATAARAVLSLPAGEAATLLVPLLRDRDEFVRREAAYALGLTRSPLGVPALAAAVETDKEASVRGAAAVALGQVRDASAVPALASALSRRLQAPGFFNRLRRRKVEEDEFVRRAAAISLGQIGSREGVPVLVETLSNARTPDDVRREAARSLGIIGDPAAIPALRAVLTHRDPYLSRTAFEALKLLDPATAARPSGGGL
ncbi:MAG: HEAT repeat domain-containing protein [Pyrinomonadaceae bacterium]